MASRKRLSAVAHNVGHSFMSPLNLVASYQGIDSELLAQCFHTRVWSVSIDLLTGLVTPASFSFPLLTAAARAYETFMRVQAQKQGLDPSIIKAASLSVHYDPGLLLPVPGSPASRKAPYECEVLLTDDLGHLHRGVTRGWSWVSASAPSPAPSLLSRLLRRFRRSAT